MRATTLLLAVVTFSVMAVLVHAITVKVVLALALSMLGAEAFS